jgi:hypothetical protein
LFVGSRFRFRLENIIRWEEKYKVTEAPRPMVLVEQMAQPR